jgi:hypothetical protein
VRAYPLANRAGLLVLRGLVCVALFSNATSANANDCPTSGNAISTDRPDFTSPPTVVPTGSVQFENGVTWSTEQRFQRCRWTGDTRTVGGRSLYGDFFQRA